MTRLLVPERGAAGPALFGVMTLVNVFIQGLQMFSDVGIGPSIIQSPRGDDEDFYNTAWTVQICRGWGLWLALTALAWPVGLFYENADLSWLLVVAGAGETIRAFNSTAVFTLSRRLKRHLDHLLRFDVADTGVIRGIIARPIQDAARTAADI